MSGEYHAATCPEPARQAEEAKSDMAVAWCRDKLALLAQRRGIRTDGRFLDAAWLARVRKVTKAEVLTVKHPGLHRAIEREVERLVASRDSATRAAHRGAWNYVPGVPREVTTTPVRDWEAA